VVIAVVVAETLQCFGLWTLQCNVRTGLGG